MMIAEGVEDGLALGDPFAIRFVQSLVFLKPLAEIGGVLVGRVEGRLELLKVAFEVKLSVEPACLDRHVVITRPRVHRERRKDVLMRLRALEKLQTLFERRPRLAPISYHHVIAELDSVLLCQESRLDDFVGRDLLVNRIENLLRSRLDTQAQSLAPGESH